MIADEERRFVWADAQEPGSFQRSARCAEGQESSYGDDGFQSALCRVIAIKLSLASDEVYGAGITRPGGPISAGLVENAPLAGSEFIDCHLCGDSMHSRQELAIR